jgi:hypothetical protein
MAGGREGVTQPTAMHSATRCPGAVTNRFVCRHRRAMLGLVIANNIRSLCGIITQVRQLIQGTAVVLSLCCELSSAFRLAASSSPPPRDLISSRVAVGVSLKRSQAHISAF